MSNIYKIEGLKRTSNDNRPYPFGPGPKATEHETKTVKFTYNGVFVKV